MSIAKTHNRIATNGRLFAAKAFPPSDWTASRVERIAITPEIAASILAERNAKNRHLRNSRVAEFAASMADGIWDDDNGDTIRFDADGNLIDGQHRLAAVVQSGITLYAWVKFGCPATSYATIDRNIARNAADDLAHDGEVNATGLAATLRVVFRWEQGHRSQALLTGYIDSRRILEVLGRHPGVRDSVRASYAIVNRVPCPIRVSAFVHYMTQQIDPAASDEFFRGVATGEELAAGDPRLALRSALFAAKARTVGDGHQRGAYASLLYFVRSWNHFRSGTKVKLLKVTTHEVRGKTIPIPIPEFHK